MGKEIVAGWHKVNLNSTGRQDQCSSNILHLHPSTFLHFIIPFPTEIDIKIDENDNDDQMIQPEIIKIETWFDLWHQQLSGLLLDVSEMWMERRQLPAISSDSHSPAGLACCWGLLRVVCTWLWSLEMIEECGWQTDWGTRQAEVESLKSK